jgi:hypothetical protein
MKIFSTTSRRTVLALGGGALAASVMGPAAASGRTVLVELFTSQGCSSCPPADALLNDLRSKKGVVALSYHVDYWDYLGWKDTLGSAEFSQRQYDYAKARGDMAVYTPQMIIDGGNHFVGSNRNVVLDAIERARAAPAGAAMSLTDNGTEIVVEIGASADAREAMVWLMPIVPRLSVKILKGEIAGQEMAYHNIVRHLTPAGMWHGKATTLTMPKDSVITPECKGCVALLQQGKAGPILGVATWGEVSA